MAMVRHRHVPGHTCRPGSCLSSRHWEEVIYREELDDLAAAGDGLEVVHTLTRSRPAGWTGYDRRIDDRMIAEVLEPLGAGDALLHLRPDGAGRGRRQRPGPAGPAGRTGSGPSGSARRAHEQGGSGDGGRRRRGASRRKRRGRAAGGHHGGRDDGGPRPVRPLPHGQRRRPSCARTPARPGTVLRCPACSGVVLRIVETPTATLVDASGIAWLRFERG